MIAQDAAAERPNVAVEGLTKVNEVAIARIPLLGGGGDFTPHIHTAASAVATFFRPLRRWGRMLN
ncbi:MAG: hypothetical protein DMG14_25135 [Acidobacteria bacterium]|nr:MAG: hypothetical protein DMG14_25135 [Acidobacteriota bacterium]